MSKAYELQRIETMNRMRDKRRDVIMNTVKKNIEGRGRSISRGFRFIQEQTLFITLKYIFYLTELKIIFIKSIDIIS